MWKAKYTDFVTEWIVFAAFLLWTKSAHQKCWEIFPIISEIKRNFLIGIHSIPSVRAETWEGQNLCKAGRFWRFTSILSCSEINRKSRFNSKYRMLDGERLQRIWWWDRWGHLPALNLVLIPVKFCDYCIVVWFGSVRLEFNPILQFLFDCKKSHAVISSYRYWDTNNQICIMWDRIQSQRKSGNPQTDSRPCGGHHARSWAVVINDVFVKLWHSHYFLSYFH